MTMRRLVLIRHSKSVAGGDVDHDRAIADRGVVDAAALGHWLAAAGVVPDRVVVSTALRARQTWEHAVAVLDIGPAIVADHRVYDNTVDALLAVLHETPPAVTTVALVGHNPSMGELADGLDNGRGDAAAVAAVAQSFPTSGVACFDVPAKWSRLALGGATLTAFAVPRG
jgi:phosphohistidine phosphatase